MKTMAMCLILGVALLLTTNEEANAEGVAKRTCYNTDLISILETQPVTGNSKLCVFKRGMTASLVGKDLVPGHAYTVWWVYFDDPSQCVGGAAPGLCGPADFGGEKPLAVLGRMDSGIARNNGKRWFTNRLRDFSPRSGSQIWLVLQTHGPMRTDSTDALARQLLTHEDLALGGTPHLTNTVDGQLGFPNALAIFAIE